jgi:hypothetical protein
VLSGAPPEDGMTHGGVVLTFDQRAMSGTILEAGSGKEIATLCLTRDWRWIVGWSSNLVGIRRLPSWLCRWWPTRLDMLMQLVWEDLVVCQPLDARFSYFLRI